jgi:hypothetical protein
MLMKVLRANFKADETTIITSNEFDALDPVSQLDILKDLIHDLRIIYSDKLKEQRLNRPSKQKIINANARERAMQAYKYRKRGWTYKAVGIIMHVSASRARSLVLKAERNLTKWQNI